MSSLSSIPIWNDERSLFMQESSLGVYSTRAYFSAVVLMDIIPLRVVPPSFFAFFSYWMIGLHPDCGMCIIWYTLVLVITNVCATMMCVAIGAITKRSMSGNLIGSSLIMFFVLFGGFLLNKDKIPAFCRWMEYTSFLHYAFELLAINEFYKSPLTFVFTSALPADVLPDLPVQGEEILRQFGFDAELFYVDATQLVVLTAVFTAVAFVGLGSIHGRIAAKISSGVRSARSVANRLGGSCIGSWTEMGGIDKAPEREGPSRPSHLTMSIGDAVEDAAQSLLDDPDQVARAKVSAAGVRSAGLPSDAHTSTSIAWQVSYMLPSICRRVLTNVTSAAGICSSTISSAGGADDSGIFAVLGPSGAGKTSLLEILSGHPMPGQVDGCVRVNGRAVRFDSMRRIAGFVPQEVVLPGTSTVWEYLMFHATLRLPPALRARDRRRIIADIIRELGLQRVQDSIIGNEFIRGLSGGERRRVSVAAELITRPAILMLDEPTTGLDSTNAAKMVDILTGLVHAGVTVLISIHQPRADVFRMLTRVLILSGEGTTVYSGPTRLAAAHFEGLGYSQRDEGAVDVGGGSSLHIADYVLDLVIRSSHDEVDRMVQGYLSSEVAAKERQCLAADEAAILSGDVASPSGDSLSTSSFPDSKYISPFRRQFALLVSRHVQKIYRNPFVTVINVFGYLLMAVFIGTVFYDTDVDSGGIQVRWSTCAVHQQLTFTVHLPSPRRTAMF